MSCRKRKKYSKDIKCVFFPDDVKPRVKTEAHEPPRPSASSSRCWQRCGESFMDTPVLKNLKSSGRRLSAVRKLARPSAIGQKVAVGLDEEPVHIAWSSSDSEQADDETDETQKQTRRLHHQLQACRPGRLTAPIQSYSRALRMLSTDKEDFPVIDTDSDLEDSGKREDDSGKHISDCDSELCDGKPEDPRVETSPVTQLEISGYVSDGGSVGGAMTSSRLDSESFSAQTGEGSKRSVSDWVRSAQAMLHTPRKRQQKQAKTPEDSAKKRRKFQSGGLAERLNRLQCRQRSAISFWRHQSNSDTSTTVDRPGVLVLEVLEVLEECSMQLAHCEQHGPDASGPRPRLLVLFNRETAAQLIPAPGDIVHIYPPWQSLSIEGFSCAIILNTHFSQKVHSASTRGDASIPRAVLPVERCAPYPLVKTFGLLEVNEAAEEEKVQQRAGPHPLCSPGPSGVTNRRCHSLLEAIEGLGQAGSVGHNVEVTVQRVYSVPAPDRSASPMLRAPPRSSWAPPAQKDKTRLCVLVQDGYGMFSVVQLHLLACEDRLRQYCQTWQGKACTLKGIKVVQRVTRERCTRLFGLIDSVWPPAMPPKEHGLSPGSPSVSRPQRPAPSFCYLLSGQEGCVELVEGGAVSPLYLPPTEQTLRDILQSKIKSFRCSFVATVVYKRSQSCNVGQGEVWLVLTDPSLQEEEAERPCRRTVAVCVSASCVLTSSVVSALKSPTACCMSFRDAIKEHGVLLCAEQSVLQMSSVEPEVRGECTARPESQSHTLTEPQPVILDPLSEEVTPNSLCSLTGVIVGVDENTAYSWPTCSLCGSDDLEMLEERLQTFRCVSCKATVDTPAMKFQLDVFLSCSSLRDCTMKVKLEQSTIVSLLNATSSPGNEFPGYDMECVLGKEVGPLTVCVRVVTRKPALWMGLEEISL
ncbi:DNA repair-scaffolding protein [Genypterus blacodes]|uniref:DNA repair-scaffolding protein n=1 Tax=Genypterus blacodes TaxID=154954 RepID=UPI003F76E214